MQYWYKKFIRPEAFDRFAKPLLLILTVILLWIIAQVFWLVVAPTKAQKSVPIPLTPNVSQSASMSNFMVFEPAQQSNSNNADLAQLQLQGVFASNLSNKGSAIIKYKEIAKEYQIGRNIENTPYTLLAVYPNRIILTDAGGQQYPIKLGQPLDLNPPPFAASANTNTNNNNVNVGDNSGVAGYNPVQNNPAYERDVEKALAAGASALSNNPAAAITNMGLVNTGQGYEVSAQTPDQMRSSFGLQPGDKVVSINGQRLGSPQQDGQLLEAIRKDRNAIIEIKRGNQTITTQQRF